ncbi:hypothetical protein LTS18_011149 [Coniosporium uncinatum]|uniref:Uncharacterized protein n=1 Tax=Coniosporium uncinatum TaxID=93489 RepID=A0ACC3DKV2_9PEZI|nr:hypothetical protein LTS18_011149 [Coniosporium uncinatum]
MAQYFIPSDNKPVSIAPSLVTKRRGVGTSEVDKHAHSGGAHFATAVPTADNAIEVKPAGKENQANGTTNGDHSYTSPPCPYPTVVEPGNPTVVPEALLRQFHFTFLIRHPRSSIPSYYRCTVPPLDEVTGFYNFRPDEAGYLELRKMFDFLKGCKQVGPGVCRTDSSCQNGEKMTNGTHANGTNGVNGVNGTNGTNGTNGISHHDEVDICVIDADDMLDNPSAMIEAYCDSVGIPFEPDMLVWDNEEDHRRAKEAFEKWKGFHEDAIESCELKKREHKHTKSDEQLYEEWTKKYGKEGADLIKKTVDENVEHYEYLKQFAIKV